MRSVVVVFPASICAIKPILRMDEESVVERLREERMAKLVDDALKYFLRIMKVFKSGKGKPTHVGFVGPNLSLFTKKGLKRP